MRFPKASEFLENLCFIGGGTKYKSFAAGGLHPTKMSFFELFNKHRHDIPSTCRKSLTSIMLSPWSRFELTTSVVIGTDCIGSCKSNYHTITATTARVAIWYFPGYLNIYLKYHLKKKKFGSGRLTRVIKVRLHQTMHVLYICFSVSNLQFDILNFLEIKFKLL